MAIAALLVQPFITFDHNHVRIYGIQKKKMFVVCCLYRKELISFVLRFGMFGGPVWVDSEVGWELFGCSEHGSFAH